MTPRFPLWAMLGVPAVAVFALFFPLLGTGFLGDDFGLLHGFDGCGGFDGMVGCVGNMFVSGVGPPSNQYRPLTMATFAFNVALGADPFAWHLVNILLHAANAALVALLAWQLLAEDTSRTRVAALMAGWLFAWFAPAVEATAWIAARFDGLALLWLLVAASTFVASRSWRDRYGLVSLGATVLSYMSKESAAIGAPLIFALAWWKQPIGVGLLRSAAAAIRTALPWLLLAASYFAFRRFLFGDPFQFFPGTSPLATMLGGAWLANIPAMIDWASMALPEMPARSVFGWSGVVLMVCALAAGAADRTKGRSLIAITFAVLSAFGQLLPLWYWAGIGDCCGVLLAIGAIALLAAALPLAAARRPRRVAWVAAIVLLGSQWMLAQAAIARWVRAGDDTRVLAAALARTASETPADGYAFVVVPDHVGAIPFGRNAQGGLMLPPVQESPLSPKLVVQTDGELARWPDLFTRDIIGRLRREPVVSIAANLLTPKVPPPHALPDRWFCWSPRTRTLVPLDLALDPDLRNWDEAWRDALSVAGCRG